MKRNTHFAIILVSFFLSALVATGVVWRSEQYRIHEIRSEISDTTRDHAHLLQITIERALTATHALEALVRQGNGTVRDFDTIARNIQKMNPGISALQLAPGGVIKQIFPYAGNEQAIGHNLLKDPARNKEAFIARDTRKLTLAGPFELIQGGLGAVGRLPVFLNAGNDDTTFWGFTTVLIRFPEILVPANFPELVKRGVNYELWRIHPDTDKKQIIASSSSVPLIDPIEQALELPNGTWKLSVAPVNGWGNPGGLSFKAVLGLLFSLLITYLSKLMLKLSAYNKELEGKVDQRTAELHQEISEHKQAESERIRLESQLRQSQKMESMGRLAGGVAHDFNNMLGVIMGHTSLALMKLERNHPLHTHLEEVNKAAERSADLTRQLLAFARKQTIAPKVLNLNETVASMLNMLQRLIGEDIHLTWQPGATLWPVKVDPSQIDQILANLCINARDSIGGIGKITIKTGDRTIDEKYSAHQADATPGEYIALTVGDDGCGMDKETMSNIFEPFFTTKSVGEGTGLGLATVFGAVKQNNGFISVDSEPGLGTTFTIYLPHYKGELGQTGVKVVEYSIPHGHETVLLVEDEPAILNMAAITMTELGYVVLAANSPSEAIRMVREFPGEIHLLMTDVIMPEMNGRDLAKTLQSFCPQIKCLFMSGYTADIIGHHGVLEEGVNFIQKPFSLSVLATKVREVLESK